MDSKSSLTFSFCGDYEVSALSVSRAIDSLVTLSSTVAEKEYPDVEFRLSVRAVNLGSLEFEFVATAMAALQTVLAPESVAYAAGIIDIMAATFKIKNFLKGKSPKSKVDVGADTVITHPNGSVLKVPKGAGNIYFIDNRIDRSITNIINAAKLSDGVTGIAIDAKDRVEIRQEDFEECSKEIDMNIQVSQFEPLVAIRSKEILFIRQADFSGELKWRFKGAGSENIVASILDEQFVESVKSGIQGIRAKMYLIADVRVTMQLTPDGLPDESRCTYDILKVHSVHIPGDGQEKIDI